MSIREIARYAKIKGLQLVGTGDFTHPQWLKEIQENLTPEADTGLYKVTSAPESQIRFMLTTEVCTIFNYKNDSKKIHHVILAPSLDHVVQINEKLCKYGSLSADGRPILNMTAPQLVEEVMQVSTENVIFPAHAWTPWFSVFGAFSGFDSIEDCYQDTIKHIHALETGLSSDPPMNWRLSKLDRFTLLSNSDSHSFWPWRMGREANVFEFEQPTYKGITGSNLHQRHQSISNSQSKPTPHMANTIGLATAIVMYLFRRRKPENWRIFARFAAENSPKG